MCSVNTAILLLNFKAKTEEKKERNKKELFLIFSPYFCVCLCYFSNCLLFILKPKVGLREPLKDAIIDGSFVIRSITLLFAFQIGV